MRNFLVSGPVRNRAEGLQKQRNSGTRARLPRVLPGRAIDFLLNSIEYSCNLFVKDLTLVSGDCIHLHYRLQARPHLMVGFLVFVYAAQLAASWLTGIGVVRIAGTMV